MDMDTDKNEQTDQKSGDNGSRTDNDKCPNEKSGDVLELRWLSVGDAKSLTGLSDRHIRRLCANKEVEARRNGRKEWEIREDTLSAYSRTERPKRKVRRTDADKVADLLAETQKQNMQLSGQVGYLQGKLESLEELKMKALPMAKQDAEESKAEASRALQQVSEERTSRITAEEERDTVRNVQKRLLVEVVILLVILLTATADAVWGIW